MDEYIEGITETLCGRAISPRICIDKIIRSVIKNLDIIAPYYFRPDRIWCNDVCFAIRCSLYYVCKDVFKNALQYSGIEFQIYIKFTYEHYDVWRMWYKKDEIEYSDPLTTDISERAATNEYGKKGIFAELAVYAGCVRKGETWYSYTPQ